MNSIGAYLIAELSENFVEGSFRIHLGASALNILGTALEPVVRGSVTLSTYWLERFTK